MPALELLTGFVTAPSTTLTALTLASGNSLTMRDTPEGADIRLLQLWYDVQTAGNLRVRSPLLHDDVQGIRFDTTSNNPRALLPNGPYQKLIEGMTLTVELSGSATGGDIESAAMLIYYESLKGVDANFMSPDEVAARTLHLTTVENTLALGTVGGYSGEEALNAEFDELKHNHEYALLGYQVDSECCSIRYRASAWGNLGIGGPGAAGPRWETTNWFVNLAKNMGVPLIPVINASDVANVLIDGATDENGTDVTVTTILAELDS